VRAPTDDGELVRAGPLRDPVAADALWDAYGPGAFAFCHRLLGDVGAAADATQDAFLLAHAERLERPEPGFGLALLRAARTTSFELLGGRARSVEPHVRGILSAAAARLRPQQRAALALAGLQGLSHADIAAVLGIAREAVPALLARARLRLHDEMHGTALAAAAVASPDCEDVLPLLASAEDGELEPGDAAWADPHVARCPTCPRTIRAMRGAAATYAAWSPAAMPSWLRAATLAEVGTQEPPSMAPARRAALPAALVSATLATAASTALLVGGARSLPPDEASLGGARLPEAARSVEMAAIARAPLAGAGHRRSRGTAVAARRSAREPIRAASVVPPASARSAPAPRSVSRLEPTPTRRPPSAPPAPDVEAPVAPVPVSADVPTDEPPAAPAVAVAASAPASPAPGEPAPQQAAATLPAPKTVVTPPPQAPAGDDDGRAPCGASDGHHA
jgi:DNA-directed RNA polymerase specialized sigma24 family protein